VAKNKSKSKVKPPRKRRLRRLLAACAVLVLGLALAAVIIVQSGLADRWMQRAIITQLEKLTGGRVELPKFHFSVFGLRAELWNLTIHGSEPAGAPPLFHADYLLVDVRVDSFFRRKFSLDEVRVDKPQIQVRVAADGSSNVPGPKSPTLPARPWHERIFEVVVRQLRITNGEIAYNDARIPLSAQGGQFDFLLDYHAPIIGQPIYVGQVNWQQMILTARRYLPFPSDVSAKFTLARDRFELNQLSWNLPHSALDVEASLGSFADPAWTFKYRGQLNLEDVRAIFRKPHSPTGRVEFTGEGSYAKAQVNVRGRYTANDVAMNFPWFHAKGMSSRGTYVANQHGIDVPDFEARVLGGSMHGRVHADFPALTFHVESHARGMQLSSAFAAVEHENFPVTSLHWAGTLAVDAVTSWTKDFKHVDSRGVSLWEPALEPGPGEIPVTARFDYHYNEDHRVIELGQGTLSTPTSRIDVSGSLGGSDSDLDVNFTAGDLLPWDDFINRLRGEDAEPQQVAGRAEWRGRVLGPLDGPEFLGHVKAWQARYATFSWDELEGDMLYSPDVFRFTKGQARHGSSSARLDLELKLSRWSFRPENQWTLDASLDRTDTEGLQQLFGRLYPARGLLTGEFHGRGTRAQPEISGLFDLTQASAWGYPVERFRGRLSVNHDGLRISDAELRATPSSAPPANGGRASPPSLITGNFTYRFADQYMEFDLAGAGIRLENISRLQTATLPMGGELNFQLKGKGPLLGLVSQGTLRLVDLRAGNEVIGSFEGKLDSDGRRVSLELRSAMNTGRLEGKVNVTLGGDYPIQADLSFEKLDLDPFLTASLRLRALTGHSSVDGRFQLHGALAHPETLEVRADLARVVFDYEFVKLENVGPVRFSYGHDEVRIEQANLRGVDTDLRITGFARFTGDRQLGLNLSGTLNMRLAGGFLPGLDARGVARVNAAVGGTFSSPRITGRAHIENTSATYKDFPAGLSQVAGDFVFDTTRLLFENVTAQSGGGQLTLGGNVTYGAGPLRYDITARAQSVRIRYPEGMSWLAGGTLRLSGTRDSGLLSGRVVLERLFMTQGFDLASMMVASKDSLRAPTTSSPFLRNLQFDIEGVSGAEARVEWTGAHFESEASLRIRGTWEHPVLLGHVHLLNGEMTFRGNRYRLTRGELNFSNPFRLDPVLNVEAATTIRQYEITLDFSGPASKLTLAYRSDPPLPASDIIALLALGGATESTELRGSTAVRTPGLGASSLLSEAISSQLGGRIERLFGISRFRVDPFLAGAGNQQNAAARVTIEQQMTHDLVITYITNVTSTQQQVIQVEYSVNRDISIIALRDQNGTFGLDVKFKKRFK
jgi:translocation and assembly module TamB